MYYILYNNDYPVAEFTYEKGSIGSYTPLKPELLPMQICGAKTTLSILKGYQVPMQIHRATPDGFTLWLQERAIDLNVTLHRRLVTEFIGSRDKSAIAIMTHMFSISDTFTCFAEGEFTPREQLCRLDKQDEVCNFILVSSDTSLRKSGTITPNASTDGSFPKTWRYENGAWWLYKLQSNEASKTEYAIGKALRDAGWNAAVYAYDSGCHKYIKTLNFVGKDEFFEPYDSLRYMFEDRSDDDLVVYANLHQLGDTIARDYRRILLADALFMNTDRHMRNYGVIRSAITGELLRMAPNFDNNQAFRSNPGMKYNDAMLKDFGHLYGWTNWDSEQLAELVEACKLQEYLTACAVIGAEFLRNQG